MDSTVGQYVALRYSGPSRHMSELSYQKLTPEQIAEGLQGLSGWQVVNGALTKTFEFESYVAGLLFANTCGLIAERLNHHPDLMIGYKKVTVSYVTHDASGLTSYDFESASRVEVIR